MSDQRAMNVQIADPGVFETMRRLTSAIRPEDLVLIGGWAVHARLAQHGKSARFTQDLDAMLTVDARPAMSKLVEVGGRQDNPIHHARLTGLPVNVDILASHPDSGLRPVPNNHDIPRVLQDPDRLRLGIPNMARLLTTRHTPVAFAHHGETIQIPVSGPGALLASKLVTLGSEDRAQEKRFWDANDALRLLQAVPAKELRDDLATMTPEEQAVFARTTDVLSAEQLARLSSHGGHPMAAQEVVVLAVRYQTITHPRPPRIKSRSDRDESESSIRQRLRNLRRWPRPADPSHRESGP